MAGRFELGIDRDGVWTALLLVWETLYQCNAISSAGLSKPYWPKEVLGQKNLSEQDADVDLSWANWEFN